MYKHIFQDLFLDDFLCNVLGDNNENLINTLMVTSNALEKYQLNQSIPYPQ